MIKIEEFQWMMAVKQPTDQVKLFDKIARNSFLYYLFSAWVATFLNIKFEISIIK